MQTVFIIASTVSFVIAVFVGIPGYALVRNPRINGAEAASYPKDEWDTIRQEKKVKGSQQLCVAIVLFVLGLILFALSCGNPLESLQHSSTVPVDF